MTRWEGTEGWTDERVEIDSYLDILNGVRVNFNQGNSGSLSMKLCVLKNGGVAALPRATIPS